MERIADAEDKVKFERGPYEMACAREQFLDMLAYGGTFEIDTDCSDGIDCTHYHITTKHDHLEDLADVLCIEGPRYMETWGDALSRAVSEYRAKKEAK